MKHQPARWPEIRCSAESVQALVYMGKPLTAMKRRATGYRWEDGDGEGRGNLRTRIALETAGFIAIFLINQDEPTNIPLKMQKLMLKTYDTKIQTDILAKIC